MLNKSWILVTINSILEVSKLLIEMILPNLILKLIVKLTLTRIEISNICTGSPFISQLKIYQLDCE